MKNRQLTQILIHLVGFFVITFIYFSPLLQGKSILQSDNVHHKGTSNYIKQHQEETGESALWNPSLFSGMPGYLTGAGNNANLVNLIVKPLYKIPHPANKLIMCLLFFYVMLLILRFNPWVAFVYSLMYGFATFIFVFLSVGHNTKVYTLSFMPLVMAGIIYAFRQNRILGALLFSLSFSWMINANHPQMTYYAGIMTVILVLAYFVDAIRKKAVPAFLKTAALLLLAATLSVGTNYGRLSTILEYGKYSMRGESDLTPKDDDQTSGLDKSYILGYSYDLGEVMTSFIPRFKGGGMAEPLGEDSNFYQELAKTQGKARARQIAERAPLYWGSQPISSAPFYFGAILCFLFVFGMFVLKGKERWWLAGTFVVALLLSLGKNIPGLANFMVDYFPAYNKFRDVKNIIVIQQFAMALAGALAIKEVYLRNIENKKFMKSLKWAFGITGGLALIFALIPSLAGDFVGQSDAQYAQMGFSSKMLEALRDDRKAVLRADAFRSFIFVALSAGVLWAFWTKKIKGQVALVLWAVLILADMWPVNKKYLNNDNFESKRKIEKPYTASKADQAILQDKDINFRVLNASLNPFADASTSYFHKSIGGYHGAKMQRYQEVIENYIAPELQQIGNRLRNVKSQADVERVFSDLSALNMLNTKYVIYAPGAAPLQNPQNLGDAWFVDNVELVENADEEIVKIGEINPAETAVVDQKFAALVPEIEGKDSLATVQLIAFEPDRVEYRTSSSKNQLVVFSEIYYPKGWNAYIDGEESPYFRANYLLRAMEVPAGEHEIVFEFKPKSYYTGNKISIISSIILLLLLGGVIGYEIKKRKTKNEA